MRAYFANRKAVLAARTTDDSFFDVIDSEAKAYWLGFLTADAGLTRNQINLRLNAVDTEHAILLRDTLRSTAPAIPIARGRGQWGGDQIHVAISSQRLVLALGRLGVTTRKSLTAQAWVGPPELMRHYWRGVFDGDGGIWRENDYWHVSLVGSESMVRSFQVFAAEVTGSIAKIRPMKTIWAFQMNGRVKPRLLTVALYEGATVALPRKLALAQELINTSPERGSRWGVYHR